MNGDVKPNKGIQLTAFGPSAHHLPGGSGQLAVSRAQPLSAPKVS